ncbi:hypothetical protein LLG39_15060, partial [bacterium]|nr:hypothetical protein [bacterium]
ANEPVDEAWGDVGASPSYYNDNGKGCLVVPRYDGHITCVDTTSFTKKWDYIDKDGEDTSDPSTPSSVTPAAEDTPGPPGSGGTSSGSEPGNTGGFTSSATMDVDNGNSQLFVGSTAGYFYCLDAAKGSLNWRYPASISSLPLGAFRYSTPVVANDSHTVHRVWCASDDGHIYSFGAGSQYRGERLYVDIDSSGKETTKPSGAPDYYEPSVLAGMRGSIAMDGTDSGTKLDKTMYVGDMSDQGVLRWFNADNGQSNWKIQDPDYPSDPTKKIAIRGWTTQGKLFSSPSITNFEVGSDPVSYVYVGGTDGRIYAFSGENGAWGGRWAGGIWPFPGDSSGTAQWERSAPETDVQFEMINPDFYQASLNADAEPKDGSDLSTPNASNTAWATGKPDWVVTREMKMPTATMATDEAVDTELTRLAKDVRKIGSSTTGIDEDDAVFPCIDDRTGTDKPIYLEWGETINLAVWNLPALEFLSGSTDSARRNSIKFYMSNTSAGSSAGSQVRINGNVRKLAQYTVLKNTDELTSTALTYPSSSEDVKRCYALAQIEIIPSNNRPFTPGPGWVITMQISKKYTSGGAMYTVNVPIARLKSGTPPEPLIIGASTGAGTFKEQLIGINNPLAIRDDNDRISGGVVSSLAWPSTGTTVFPTDRQNFQAHFNGNAELADGGVFNVNKMPTIDLLFVNHGTSSREGWLGIMDRSAMGTKTSRTIDKFRIDASELRWRNISNTNNGFEETVKNSGGITFPWEFGAGSIDYPNIYRQRQSYRLESKDSDGADPTNASTKLSPVVNNGLGKGYEYCLMQPDTVYIGVGVPKFQPANIGNKSASSTSLSRFGFSRRMPAYVDLNGNKKFDNGNTIIGKQNTYIETYRNFIVGISVPPDPKIEVSEQLIDVGRAPHGLGVDMGADKAFSPYNSDADVQQWFKTVTIKNAGNVNLPHMRISDRLSNGSYSRMLSDFTSTVASFPTGQIVSSLDAVPAGGYGGYASEPFITSGLGYTLTKARVGDPDPSVLTIPDKRKWDSDYNDTQTNARAGLGNFGTEDPLPVKVSIKVPLTQPIGTYSTYIEDFNLPYVPVFSDRNPVDGIYNVGLEPAAETSFQLKVSVRENQLTGGVTPTTLPQIDITQTGTDANTGMITNETPRVGDATPAAFRNTGQDGYGDVHLFWSSNRMFDPTLYPNWNNPDDSKIADFANAPWFINHAALKWNSNSGWEPVTGTTSSGATAARQWWKVPDPNATDFSANTSTLPGKNRQWPDDLKVGLVPWVFGTSDTGFYSVRHHSPVIGQTFANDKINPADPTWLAWVGTADKTDPSTNKVYQEHVLHYTNATSGDITSNSSAIEYIEHDPQTPKRYPSLSVYNDRMWMFWQSGDKTGWSIDYSTNDAYNFPTAGWEIDNKLKVADCLTSVSSPNAVLRRFWGDLRSPDYSNARGLFDVVYAGTSKYDQTADVYLSRYLAVNQSDVRDASGNSSLQTAIAEAFPSRMAQPLPRIYSEKLVRDSKYGYFSSKNLAWIRLSRQSYDSMSNWNAAILTSTLTDHIGETEHNKLEEYLDGEVPTPVNPQLYNLPYVWVELPSGYPGVPPNSKLRISATDGSAMSSTNNGGWTELDAGTAIIPTIDDSTGIYTFKYPDKTLATQILGSTMIDFSSGIVRFTKELKEIKRTTDEGFDSADVYADYTPQTWRITTGQAVNNSPRAFIEHTKMSSAANPGLVPNWPRFTDNSLIAPVDRLWVFWRKAGTGVKSSTIFYSTYRVGVDLAKLGKPPIRIDDSGRIETSAGLDITNNLGPWEVDRTGTKIYFTEVDERYRSLLLSGSANALINGRANPPSNLAVTSAGKVNPIKITYKPVGAEDNEPPPITVDVNDVSWIVEQPEQSLLGYSSDGNINEGSIYAFADPEPTDGTLQPLLSSKIWVFWTSTRGGTSDLFWETLSPNFSAR